LNKKTLAIIKPDAISKNYTGKIISRILDAGFKIKAMKMVRVSRSSAEGFYRIHKGRPFYEALIDYITSEPVIAIALEKENAVKDFRKLIGATDPAKAEEGTIRKLYAINTRENAIHGSDSNENAAIEISHFFSSHELLNNYND
jgi:nucleoside-diphosphate kinase